MDSMKLINRGIIKNSQTKILYFLDRNIISLIKEVNEGKVINDKNKQDLLTKLTQIDNEKSIITPILSLFEGQHGRMEKLEQIPNTIREETNAISFFFKKAAVDDSFIEMQQDFVEGKTSDEYQCNIQEKVHFLEEINEYLFQPLSKEKRNKAKETIITLHHEKYEQFFDKFNPVVVLSLCCLYGNQICKKILKPKADVRETNFYNAVMDIHHFSAFATLTGKLEGTYSYRHNAKLRCEFLSSDKSLNDFFNWFKMNQSLSAISNDTIHINVVLNEEGIKNIPVELKEFWALNIK